MPHKSPQVCVLMQSCHTAASRTSSRRNVAMLTQFAGDWGSTSPSSPAIFTSPHLSAGGDGLSITQPEMKTPFSKHQPWITGEQRMFALLINRIRAVNELDAGCSQLINLESSNSSHLGSEQGRGSGFWPHNLQRTSAAFHGMLREFGKERPQRSLPPRLRGLINVNNKMISNAK